jgi:ribosomal-protein-alanine N-acetyltransferase
VAILFTERLILRQVEVSDAEQLELLINDFDVASTTLNIPYPYPKGSATAFINKENDAFMGSIGMNINQKHNRAELGYWLGKRYWNQGYVTEGVKRIIKYGFEELKLNKIHAGALTRNPASSSVITKSGMQYEGTFRQHFHKWDQYEDVVYYGILREDYLKIGSFE